MPLEMLATNTVLDKWEEKNKKNIHHDYTLHCKPYQSLRFISSQLIIWFFPRKKEGKKEKKGSNV